MKWGHLLRMELLAVLNGPAVLQPRYLQTLM